MKFLVFKTKKEAVKEAADILCKVIRIKPDAVLGLATGGTMIPFYRELVKRYREGEVDFSKVATFNIDEFAGLNPEDKNSYHYYMDKYFFSKVNIKIKQTHFPSASGSDYDSQIKKAGGLDLCMLGIGENGHIAFNEPGSSFKSLTRKIKITENTRKVDSRFFKSVSQVPREAYTAGISTIMKARKIILLAFGNKKADAVARTIRGKISEKVPASALRKHKDATVVVDSRAAARGSNNANSRAQ